MRVILLLLIALCLPAGHAQAAQSAILATDHDKVSLVSQSDDYVPGKPVLLGLRLQLAPGWHTYWSNPGDAGEAPTVVITASGRPGTADAIDFPTPERLPDGPLMSYGYTGDAVLPISLQPGASPGTLHLTAKAQWLACANVCIPENGTFRLDLPQAASGHEAAASAEAPLFAAVRHPLASPFPAVLSDRHVLTLSGSGLGPQAVHDAWFFPDVPGVIDQIALQPVRIGKGRVAITLTPAAGAKMPSRLTGLVVLRDPAGNESDLSVTATRAEPVAGAWSGLPKLLLLAFAGGIVLNLMPCVFPVLAMKAVALTRLSGAPRAAMRSSAVLYSAGVLVAFAALGGLMIGLRAAGSLVGWGFQFQSSIFVAATCWLLFALGLNLAGMFEIGASAAGLGQGLTTRRGHGGDFATGLLAVLVATPCTAPFMGVAIAGALSAPAAAGMMVFLAMGLGLALPYALVAMSPRLAGWLPRPGAWMELMRQALSFPVFATCAWLAWVASIEGGDRAVLILASGLVLLALAGWLLRLSQRLALSRPAWLLAAASLSAIAALALLPALTGANPQARTASARAGTEAFSETRLAALRAANRPVFVDMTAAWCVTCLVNERIALSTPSVRAAFASRHVATLRGDWTNRDASISAFLRAHGRDGVPFYVYYPAGSDGRELPQILTAERVLHEIGASTD